MKSSTVASPLTSSKGNPVCISAPCVGTWRRYLAQVGHRLMKAAKSVHHVGQYTRDWTAALVFFRRKWPPVISPCAIDRNSVRSSFGQTTCHLSNFPSLDSNRRLRRPSQRPRRGHCFHRVFTLLDFDDTVSQLGCPASDSNASMMYPISGSVRCA